jgi:hypothetical protein
MEETVRQLDRVGVAVMIGLPMALMALGVVGGLTGNLWLLVAMLAVIWGLVTAGPALARRERGAPRWVAGAGGSAGLALLVASIVLGDPWLFVAVTIVVVLGGLIAGAIYAVISHATRRPQPPA